VQTGEEGGFYFAFELLEGLAYGRLRYMQGFCGGHDAFPGKHMEEDFEPIEIL
jgi:hypothetical protein